MSLQIVKVKVRKRLRGQWTLGHLRTCVLPTWRELSTSYWQSRHIGQFHHLPMIPKMQRQ
ncbi:hypothetical protein DPMN_110891 [Dreissena polymorpha]|uniref:Uncharacterized protein n=1 Tax=Dreissena polymorpha TaxID=45954 RepID=A0A9D4KCU6_DREPO|nr:hypothetical protein DPMN_110891 [Dreissena polymorpha]